MTHLKIINVIFFKQIRCVNICIVENVYNLRQEEEIMRKKYQKLRQRGILGSDSRRPSIILYSAALPCPRQLT